MTKKYKIIAEFLKKWKKLCRKNGCYECPMGLYCDAGFKTIPMDLDLRKFVPAAKRSGLIT